MNQLPGITINHCLKPCFLKILALFVGFVLMMPSRSHNFYTDNKVRPSLVQVNEKKISGVGGISRNQTLFLEKTEQLYYFRVCVCLYSSTVKASSVCKMSETYLRVRINDVML